MLHGLVARWALLGRRGASVGHNRVSFEKLHYIEELAASRNLGAHLRCASDDIYPAWAPCPGITDDDVGILGGTLAVDISSTIGAIVVEGIKIFGRRMLTWDTA